MNNRINIFIISLLTLISINIFSQASSNLGSIKGNIKDGSNNEAVEFANVVLMKVDSSVVAGVMSEQGGRFEFKNVANGKYMLKIMFIGYQTKFVNDIQINNNKKKIELGTIIFEPSILNLGEVVVTAERDAIVNKIDRKVINVDSDLQNSGGTVTDILQNVPSVTAEQDGSIKLRGNSNVIVLIDGKPSGMSGADGGDIIGMIPASSIERIEIITNPSVKYDPDGTSGMINIIMKKTEDKGFNGIVNLNVGTNDKYNLSMTLNKSSRKFNYYFGADVRSDNRYSEEKVNSIPQNTEINQSIYQESEDNGNSQMYNINGGIDYKISKKDILGINVRFREFVRTGIDEYKYKYVQDGDVLRYSERESDGYRNFKSNEYLLSYNKILEKGKREILTEASYSTNNHKRNTDIEQTNFNSLNEFENNINQKTRIKNSNQSLFLQSNFFNRKDDKTNFEIGFKTSYRNMDMSNQMDVMEQLQNEWINTMSYGYTFQENINSVYSTYAGELFKFSYQAGLRLEHFDSRSKFINNEDGFNINYLNYYPSLHISKEINSKYEYILSYSKRVNRPHPRQMNPYIDYSDSANISQGNPNLKPEYINSLETGLIRRIKDGSIMLNLFYKHSDNVISKVIYKNENGINYLTFQNIAKHINYGTDLSFSKNFSRFFKLNSNISYYKNVYEEPTINALKMEENSWAFRLSPSFNIKKIATLGISFAYNSPNVSGQSKYDESYYCDISIKRNIIKNKLDITLRATDVFNTRSQYYITKTDNYTITNDKKRESQVVYLGISYKFNNYKEKNIKRRTSEDEEYY